MKVALFQLFVLCCIVSVAACEKVKVNSKRGTFNGGTFIGPNKLSNSNKNVQEKRGTFKGGSFQGGNFFKRSNMTESNRLDDKEKRGTFNGGTFKGGNFFKRSNLVKSKRLDGNNMENVIENGSFQDGNFFKRSNMTESNRLDDNEKRGTFNGGSFKGGNFFKRRNLIGSKELPPILPNDFTGVINLKPGLAVVSGKTHGLDVIGFSHSYKYEIFIIYSMQELKTKEEQRNVLVEAEKKRRQGIKEGKKGIEKGRNAVKEAIKMASRFKANLPQGLKL